MTLPSWLAPVEHRRSDSCTPAPLASDISALHFNGTKLKISVDGKTSQKGYPTFVVDSLKKCSKEHDSDSRDSDSDNDSSSDDDDGGSSDDDHDVHAVFECKSLSSKFHDLAITNSQGMNITLCLDPGVVTRLPSSTQTSSPPTDASSTSPSNTSTHSEPEHTSSLYPGSTSTTVSTSSSNSTSLDGGSVTSSISITPSYTVSTTPSTASTDPAGQSVSSSTSSPPSSSTQSRVSQAAGHSRLPVIIGSTLSALVLIVLIIVGTLVWRRRKRRNDSRVQSRSHYGDDVSDTGTTTKPSLTTWSPDMFQVSSCPPTRTAQHALVAPPRDSSEHAFTYLADASSQLSSMSPYSSYSSKPLLFPSEGSEDGDRGSLSLHPSDSQVSWHAY
ncbi:hypothetical protein K466DRAFT_604749 [Polyporus arcularius HHB13444]|uniref:Uncharacterized protein n=1 Tax=Polyporus arcularius HHB13444 TaxID=1314778 RepID=A0A5C3NYM6_9APHY|nr:hypothetical protein K466DRAFT_604749 [Polyporus arcularius HHB13444]